MNKFETLKFSASRIKPTVKRVNNLIIKKSEQHIISAKYWWDDYGLFVGLGLFAFGGISTVALTITGLYWEQNLLSAALVPPLALTGLGTSIVANAFMKS